jgi:hypothetical protein
MTTKLQSEQQLVLTRLIRARAETDRILQIVRPEFLYERPIAERHRIVFYIGHLEAFDWNLLSGPLGLSSFHRDYDRLFAFGIDPVEGNLPTDRAADWPSLKLIYDYCERIRQTLDESLAARDFGDLEDAGLNRLLNVAIEHRLMHAETLAYIFHQMPFENKRGSFPAVPRDPHREPAPAMVHIPAGRATLGLSRSSHVFGWDNEFESHTVDEAAFLIDKYKVTNGRFLPSLEPRRLELENSSGRSSACVLDQTNRWLGMASDVRRSSPSTRLAGLCEPRGGKCLREVGRLLSSHRRAVASGCIWDSRRGRAGISVGKRTACGSA